MGLWAEIEQEAIKENSENIAANLIKSGKEALEDIAKYCGLTLQRVQELANSIS